MVQATERERRRRVSCSNEVVPMKFQELPAQQMITESVDSDTHHQVYPLISSQIRVHVSSHLPRILDGHLSERFLRTNIIKEDQDWSDSDTHNHLYWIYIWK